MSLARVLSSPLEIRNFWGWRSPACTVPVLTPRARMHGPVHAIEVVDYCVTCLVPYPFGGGKLVWTCVWMGVDGGRSLMRVVPRHEVGNWALNGWNNRFLD